MLKICILNIKYLYLQYNNKISINLLNIKIMKKVNKILTGLLVISMFFAGFRLYNEYHNVQKERLAKIENAYYKCQDYLWEHPDELDRQQIDSLYNHYLNE